MCTYIYTYVCMQIFLCTYLHNIYICMLYYTYITYVHTYIHNHENTCTFVYICIYKRICSFVCLYLSIYSLFLYFILNTRFLAYKKQYVHMCVYIYIHVHMYLAFCFPHLFFVVGRSCFGSEDSWQALSCWLCLVLCAIGGLGCLILIHLPSQLRMLGAL